MRRAALVRDCAGVLGIQNEGEALNVTRELVRHGYDDAQIQKICGGNFLRVFREVVAQALGETRWQETAH